MSINSDDVASALTRTPINTMHTLMFAACVKAPHQVWAGKAVDAGINGLLAAHGWSLNTYANACRCEIAHIAAPEHKHIGMKYAFAHYG